GLDQRSLFRGELAKRIRQCAREANRPVGLSAGRREPRNLAQQLHRRGALAERREASRERHAMSGIAGTQLDRAREGSPCLRGASAGAAANPRCAASNRARSRSSPARRSAVAPSILVVAWGPEHAAAAATSPANAATPVNAWTAAAENGRTRSAVSVTSRIE